MRFASLLSKERLKIRMLRSAPRRAGTINRFEEELEACAAGLEQDDPTYRARAARILGSYRTRARKYLPISKPPLTMTLTFALPSPRRSDGFEVANRLQPTDGSDGLSGSREVQEEWNSYGESDPDIEKTLKAIVGFDIEMSRLEGKSIFNQNHPEETVGR